jgi:hypothetical protein
MRGNSFRAGKVHVCAEMCETCVFRPGNKMHLEPGRLRGMVDSAIRDDSAIICHDTLDGDNAVCRGFFDRHSTNPLRMAEHLGVIEWQ